MRRKKYLWLYVTHDKFEWPIAIGDSMRDLARQIGKEPLAVGDAYYKSIKRGSNSRIKRVPLEEDDV